MPGTRQARVLAHIRGFTAAFEPCHNGQPCQGAAIRRAIRAHWTPPNWRPRKSAMSSPTAEHSQRRPHRGPSHLRHPGRRAGHGAEELFRSFGAAGGAVEAVLGVLAFERGSVPPTLNYEYPDPQCPINVIHGQPLPLSQPNVLILSHSLNGQALAVVLGGAE